MTSECARLVRYDYIQVAIVSFSRHYQLLSCEQVKLTFVLHFLGTTINEYFLQLDKIQIVKIVVFFVVLELYSLSDRYTHPKMCEPAHDIIPPVRKS